MLEFAADDVVIRHRIAAIGRHRLDQMHENAGPLDVPQEFVPQADAGMRPFDQAGQIGHDERAVAVDIDHAQIRDTWW